MDQRPVDSMQWLKDELEFMNGKMGATLNGRMKPALESVCDESKELALRFPLLDWEINGIQTLHGGMMSTMMDLTMSMAIYLYSGGSVPPTISLTVNYLRPVPMEGSVLVKTRVTSIGKKNATAYCETIVPATGKIAATAIGTYAVIPAK